MTVDGEHISKEELDSDASQKWYQSPVKLLFALYLACTIGLLVPTLKSIIPVDDEYQSILGETAGGDFSVFYTAGQMALEDSYTDIYDAEKFQAKREETFAALGDEKLYFNYPPPTLLLWLPFSNLSYTVAYSLWVGMLLVGMAILIYKYTNHRVITAAALISPAFLWCIITGQLGFLTAIIMGTGLYTLSKGKHITSGLIFGLMIFKPHLALALPFVLIPLKEWRVISSGLVSATTMILLSLVVFGPEAWVAWAEQIGGNVTGHLSADGDIAERIPTLYVSLMNLTNNENIAAILHSAGALFGMAATTLIWRRSKDTIARLLTLFVAPALISPYYFDYDLTGLGLVFALLAASLAKDKDNRELLMATAGIWVITLFMVYGKINLVFTGPLFMIALMAYALWRAKVTPDPRQT